MFPDEEVAEVVETEVKDVAQTEAPDPEIEAEARKGGWVPPTEWRGDPPKNGFISADEFVRRGIPKKLRETEELLRSTRDELERERKERGETVSRIEKMSRVALDTQRKKLEADFEARMDAAAEVGDVAQVRALRKESRVALDEFDEKTADEPETKKAEGKAELPSHITKAITGWVEENPWFKSDEEMNRVANLRHERLLKEKPGLSIDENLAEVRAYVAKRYPEAFTVDDDEDEPKPRVSRVEGGTRTNGGGNGGSWSKLPADAKAQADKFIKDDGLFLEKDETVEKNLTQARERYAKQYLES